MTKEKIIRISVAVGAAALLFGGVYLMFKDEVQNSFEEKRIAEYKPKVVTQQQIQIIPETDSGNDEIPIIDDDTVKEMKAAIKDFNKDFQGGVAWLTIPDTAINYPIMYSGDNSYYLHRATDGSYLYAGSLFMDYTCDKNLSSFNTIIYGHNMRDGTKFAELPCFKNADFFSRHKYAYLSTEDNVYTVKLFATAEIRHDSMLYLAEPNVSEWKQLLKDSAMFYDETDVSDNDRLIMLSTCSGDYSPWRTVVFGKIQKG